MTDISELPAAQIEPVEADLDGIGMSGLVARVAQPRGVVLALHGGGSRAAYFHGPVHPDQSLLRVAAGLGYTTLALDQPGYAASAGQVGGWSLDRRADLIARTLSAMVDDVGAGVVVIAHSQGTQVATHLAARSASVIGLEISGTGLERRDPRASPAGDRNAPLDPADRSAQGRRVFQTIWGDPGLYPDGALAREHTRSTATPPSELPDALAWPTRFPQVAARITVLVRITVAEHEGFWQSSPESQARIAALFTAAPRVQTAVQPDAPHNISLSLAARAYHLHVLAFAEECVLWARRSG